MILDLGPASEPHLRIFRRYARKVRFAGLLPSPPRGAALRDALQGLPPHAERPYDVVFAWNVLDLLEERERGYLVERLAEIAAPDALLHAMVDGSDAPARRAMRFSLVGPATVAQKAVVPSVPGGRPLLPAHVERVLAPFEVVRGFTLRGGLREYLAMKAPPRIRARAPGR